MGVYSISVVGESFDDRQRTISKCRAGAKAFLVREPENKYDENAIAVYTEVGIFKSRKQIGYIGRDNAEWMAEIIDGDGDIQATIEKIIGGEEDKPSLGVILKIRTADDVD